MEKTEEKITAVIVAAGRGSRMGTEVSKQYLLLGGRPVLAHTLAVFQEHPRIGDIVLVTGKAEISDVRREIVERYAFTKVRAVVAGGSERCVSVYRGLCACEGTDYVYIQDAVRPFVTAEILENAYTVVKRFGNAVCGVPVKDTIKRADASGIVRETLPRETLWAVQTPQVFAYRLIRNAYDRLLAETAGDPTVMESITDDASVLEMAGGEVHLFPGDHRNIKLTTPEDLLIAELFLKERPEEP